MKEARHKITYNRIPFIEHPKAGDKNPALFGESCVSGKALKKKQGHRHYESHDIGYL